MVDLILLNVSYLIILIYFLYKLKHGFHIYQLEYYKHNRYKLWRKKNPEAVIKIRDICLLFSGLFLIINFRVGVILNLVFSIFLWFSRDIYPEKTKLNWTRRIKITYSISIIVFLVFVGLVNMFGVKGLESQINVASLAIMNFIVAIITILTMYFLIPISDFIQIFENIKNKKFYKQAKTKLKSMPDLKIVGITGSYGKTSVKNILATILKQKYNTFMTPGNFNTLLGVQRSINEHLKPTDEVFICEMGAKEVGSIAKICELVEPQMGILTAIGPQHLETFGSLNNIKRAKMELINSIPDEGTRIVNFENENIRDAVEEKDVVKYGLDKKDEFYAYNIEITDKGSKFDIHTPDGDIKEIRTKLIGKLNIINIVGAVAAAINLGVSQEDVKTGLRLLNPVNHRLELNKYQDGSMIIDDAYNSNIEGAANAFQTLKLFKNKFKIIVTPGLVDLGNESEKYNIEFGRRAAGCADLYILVGEKQAKAIKKGLLEEEVPEEKICVVSTINNAIQKYNEYEASNRVVLLENDLPDNYL